MIIVENEALLFIRSSAVESSIIDDNSGFDNTCRVLFHIDPS